MQYTRGETIEARVHTVRRLSRWAATAVRSWKLIDANIDFDETSDFLDPYRPYLVVSAHSHRELGFLYLNAVFERRDDTVNFHSICKHLQRHGVEVGHIQEDINRYATELRKLHAIRGAAIGHRTNAQSYDETFAKIRMTLDELEELVMLSRRCSNALAAAVGIKPEPLMADPVTYLGDILDTLAAATKSKQQSSPWN